MFKIVRSRDHIPPHVHIINGDDWHVLIGFSFICDHVYLYRTEFGDSKLKAKELKDLKEEIKEERVKWRIEWVRKNPNAGLNYKNKSIYDDGNGNYSIIPKNKKLHHIKSEKFENNEVILTLSNKAEIRITPDSGSKEDF